MSWVSTFTRFRAGPFPLGPLNVRVEDWSRPKTGEGPMFDNPVLERLTCARPPLPFAIYAPAGVWLVWGASRAGASAGTVAAAYAAGLLGWSLLEYVMHRVSFHHVPATPAQVAYGYLVHGVHHAYPDDSRRWMLPLVVTLPIAALLFWLCGVVLGRYGAPAFGGFIHGYLVYDLLHYFMHKGRMPTRLGRFLRQYHLAHHYVVPDRHFGVSSPLWDLIFRTK